MRRGNTSTDVAINQYAQQDEEGKNLGYLDRVSDQEEIK